MTESFKIAYNYEVARNLWKQAKVDFLKQIEELDFQKELYKFMKSIIKNELVHQNVVWLKFYFKYNNCQVDIRAGKIRFEPEPVFLCVMNNQGDEHRVLGKINPATIESDQIFDSDAENNKISALQVVVDRSQGVFTPNAPDNADDLTTVGEEIITLLKEKVESYGWNAKARGQNVNSDKVFEYSILVDNPCGTNW